MQENKRYSITPEIQLDVFEKYKSGEITEDEYRQIISNEKVLNPVEIANLTENDANTTPKLEKQKGCR